MDRAQIEKALDEGRRMAAMVRAAGGAQSAGVLVAEGDSWCRVLRIRLYWSDVTGETAVMLW